MTGINRSDDRCMTSALNLSCAIHIVNLGERLFFWSYRQEEEGPTYRNDLLISMLQLLNSISAGAPSSIIRTISHDQLGTLTRLDDKFQEGLTLLDLGAVHISLDPSHLSVTQLQPIQIHKANQLPNSDVICKSSKAM
jgi:hypothetical protein